ncbi:MAG: ComEA family DNA-binding protein [Caldimicrobium sp.]
MFFYRYILIIFFLYFNYTSNVCCSTINIQEKIDINRATLEQLKSLPGIGEVTAKAIIDLREKKGGFKSIEELKEVKGIGEKKLEVLRNYVTIGSESKDITSVILTGNTSSDPMKLNKRKIYFYKDEKGILHYTQFPETVPEKYKQSLKPIF